MRAQALSPTVKRSSAALLALFCACLALPSAGLIDFDRLLALADARFGDDGVERVREWRSFTEQSVPLARAEQLAATNDFFNQRLRWRSDQEIYGVDDYWATPLEALGRLEADCEDFTIAKYITLLSLGFAPQSLRLVYVIAELDGGVTQAHMVLAWYLAPGATPLILDNINPRVLPADQRGDLKPVFSFNASELWIDGAGRASTANPKSRLSRWRQVLDRINEEGLLAD
jgi:predicted transglutaminase-like cysteine proteinase